MRSVAVLNMKGGVGKTTVAVNIAYALAAMFDKRVLLVDVDPQFNASTSLMSADQYLRHVNDPAKKTILDIFRPNVERMNTARIRQGKKGVGSIDLKDCIFTVHPSLSGTLDLIPSNLLMMELQLSERGVENKLKNFLREKAQGYDYVFLDCPPTISIFTQAAVLASTHYLIPVKPDPLSSVGLPLLERWLEDFAQDYTITPKMVGIVFTMVKSRPTIQMREVMRTVREDHPESVFQSTFREATIAARATAANSPILHMSPNHAVAQDVRDIAKEFLMRVKE